MSLKVPEVIAALGKYEAELESMLSRFRETQSGIDIAEGDEARFREIVLELRDFFDDEFVDRHRHSRPLLAFFQDAIANMYGTPSYHGVESVKTVVTSALRRVERSALPLRSSIVAGAQFASDSLNIVGLIAERMHSVVRQLRVRREGRPTLDVGDEYDLQDLLHVLLTVHFDDIRREEWTPSYGGASSRMDFLLPEFGAVVETKMTRTGMTAKKLGEELIIDQAKYRKHPNCRRLYCLVYDPLGQIANPRGVETDLSAEDPQFSSTVLIVPR